MTEEEALEMVKKIEEETNWSAYICEYEEDYGYYYVVFISPEGSNDESLGTEWEIEDFVDRWKQNPDSIPYNK